MLICLENTSKSTSRDGHRSAQRRRKLCSVTQGTGINTELYKVMQYLDNAGRRENTVFRQYRGRVM